MEVPVHRTLPLLVSLLVLLPGCGETASESPTMATRVNLAHLAFDALQADDFEQFRSALPTAADTLWMMEAVTAGASPERAQSTRDALAREGGEDAVAEEAEKRIRESFVAVREAAAEAFDWGRATFGGLIEEKSEITHSSGLDFADVFFTIEQGERREILRLARCARIRDRWVVTGELHFRPSPHGSLAEARIRMAKMHLRSLQDVVKLYQLKHDRLPESMDVLLEPDPDTGNTLVQPDLSDPWDNAFRVEVVDGKSRLTSMGPDGELGTEDDIVWPESDAE